MKPPILETGTSIPNRPKTRQRGFTLFEILVVVVIVIITVTAVVFSTSISRGDEDLKILGKDISKLIHLLYQEAIFENRHYAISLHSEGFSVLEFNSEEWLVSEQSFFRKIKLAEHQSSRLVVEEQDVAPVDPDKPTPHIYILSTAEMSSFEWEISDEYLGSKITLQGDLLGNVLLFGPEPLF